MSVSMRLFAPVIFVLLLSLSHGSNVTCHQVYALASSDRCQFVLSNPNCLAHDLGLVRYIRLYFCHHSLHMLLPLLIMVLLVVLFSCLGLAASEHLCPNLNSISKLLHLNENVAGVTLLAFGNGSPDLFSTYSSFKLGAMSLALGELLGAALFITSVVVGSMAIVHPFTVNKFSLSRDVVFLLLSLFTLSVFLYADGGISKAACVVLLSLYLGYVVMILVWQMVSTKLTSKSRLELKSRNQYIDDIILPSEDPQETQLSSIAELIDSDFTLSDNPFLDSGSAQVAESAHDDEYRNYSQQIESLSAGEESSYFVRPSLIEAIEVNQPTVPAAWLTSPAEDQLTMHSLPRPGSAGSSLLPIMVSSAPSFLDTNSLEPVQVPSRLLQDKNSALRLLFPRLVGFASRTFADKVLTVLVLPLLGLLRCTVPVIKYAWIKDGFNTIAELDGLKLIYSSVSESVRREKYTSILDQANLTGCTPEETLVLVVQVVGANVLVPASFPFGSFTYYTIILPASIVSGLAQAKLTSYLFAHRLMADVAPSRAKLLIRLRIVLTGILAVFGFAASIVWIYMIAEEVVSVLRFYSVVFRISDAILGFSLFAVGNSLGDFIANFTIAKMGYSGMALSACFGGPLFNILVGIGGSGLLVGSAPVLYEVELNATLVVTTLLLFCNLVFLLLILPRNHWKMDKRVGLVTISFWAVAMVINTVIEVVGGRPEK